MTDDRVHLRLLGGGQFTARRIVLALGTSEEPHWPAWPCAPCGYPVLDSVLRWHPRVHVTGALADLELGPVSRNIAGARRAADRILSSLPKAKTEERLHASAR